ncbi:MAG: UPF0182 family protein [Candidatus Hydrothermarchaeales archaeon]
MSDRWMKINIAILILILLFFTMGIGLYTDWLWFKAVGYSSVFLKILWMKIAVAAVVGIAFFIFAYINAVIANKPYYVSVSGEDEAPTMEIPENLGKLVIAILLTLSFFFGFIASLGWDTILLYLNKVPFGVAEPLFAKDVGFYVFTLPFYEFIWNALFYGILLAGAVTVVVYMIRSKSILLNYMTSEIKFETPKFTSKAKMHLSFLGGLIFLLFAIRYRLDMYHLLYSTRGVVVGATYTDVKVQLPVLKLLIAVALFGALILFANMKFRGVSYPVAAVVLLFGISFLVGGIYPGLVQQYRVKPNEIKFERPYIERNIKYTTLAYGLADVEEKDFAMSYDLTWDDIQGNLGTIENIRLWDNRPLKDTYSQLQEIRLYYDFVGVDMDRYYIDGEYREVMLSARELNQGKLKQEAKTWINKHLIYTHGYGIAMSPVNLISEEGLPEFLIKDIPPESEHITIERPEIYYGEETDGYVIVNTKQKEFDYPKGDENIFSTYKGDGGVELDSEFKRLLMATRFGSPDMILNRDITHESGIMFYRNIRDRVRVIAPFLKYDQNPYPIISDGKIYWIQDAYTMTNNYPYSNPYSAPRYSPYSGIKYIRNSVKVVIDAYNGKVTYYIADQDDPIINAWAAIFPKLFRPISEMPEETLMHIRYPEDLFQIQAETYAKYHMRDPGVFYNQEDLWSVPKEKYGRQEQLVEPYYIIMKLPDGDREEFILMLPFTPLDRDNMIAWMFARSDQPDYGKVGLYKFEKKELIYGPMQIEARIDQDAEISEQLTLWGQVGSEVIRGNLLVIPIENSILYVEPLYLQAERGRIPELKRVIAVYGPRLTMEEDLTTSLAKLFEVTVTPAPVERVEVNLTREDLITSALAHYEQAQIHLREGNWTGYGRELEELKEDLLRLKEARETLLSSSPQ